MHDLHMFILNIIFNNVSCYLRLTLLYLQKRQVRGANLSILPVWQYACVTVNKDEVEVTSTASIFGFHKNRVLTSPSQQSGWQHARLENVAFSE